jgi:hypothetical protein
MLLDIYAESFNTPLRVEPIGWDGNLGGITKVAAEPGGSYRHTYEATTPPPLEIERGDVINGQVSGQFFQTISRSDTPIAQAATIHELDIRRVDAAMGRFARVGESHRYGIMATAARRTWRAAALAARGSTSETVTVGSTTLFAHEAGTRITRTSSQSTVDAAVTAAYDYTDANKRVLLFNDLRLLKLRLDRLNHPTGPGARNCVMDYEAMTSLNSYLLSQNFDNNNAVIGANGGILPQGAIYLPIFDLTILGSVNRYSGSDLVTPTNGNIGAGLLPAANITDGPSVVRGNFLPGAGSGYPVLIGMVAGSEKGAVHYTEEMPMKTIDDEKKLALTKTIASVACYTIAPLCPQQAFSIEVTNT